MQKDIYNTNDIEQTPEEKFQALVNLKNKFEENFVTMGQLLSEIKATKLFKKKGYKSFKDFVEKEYNISNSFAGKLIKNYNLYINELDLDEEKVKEIGLDKLNMISSFVKKAGYHEAEDWINIAEKHDTTRLREEIKDEREKRKEQNKTMKDIFIEQYKERMVQVFNCSNKELTFKLALFFQDADFSKIKENINAMEKRFNDEVDAQLDN